LKWDALAPIVVEILFVFFEKNKKIVTDSGIKLLKILPKIRHLVDIWKLI